MIRAQINEDKVVTLYLTSSGTPVSGLTSGDVDPVYVRKEGGSATAITVDGTTFSEVDAANMPGSYELEIPDTVLDTLGEFILYTNNASYDPFFLRLEVVPEFTPVDLSPVTDSLDDAKGATFDTSTDSLEALRNENVSRFDDVDAALARVLGLTQENIRIDNHVYDASGNLVQSSLTLYPTKNDLILDDNEIATYTMLATYDGDNNLVDYTVRRES